MTVEEDKPARPISRRQFIDYVIGGSFVLAGVSLLGTVMGYLWPPRRVSSAGGTEKVKVGKTSDIPKGTAKLVSFRNKPVLVINTEEGFVALSAICTHLGCIVKWDSRKKVVWCPCHAAFFDEHGNILSGPPPRPLPKVPVTVIDDTVYLGKAV